MRKFLVPLAAVLALSCSNLALAEDSDEPQLPPSIIKCYESVEADSQEVECTHLEADYWETQVNVVLRQAMRKCSRWGRPYAETDPKSDYTERCQNKLQKGYEAWFAYKQAMLDSQCSVNPDGYLSYECAVIRSRLAREYRDVIYAFYRLYQDDSLAY